MSTAKTILGIVPTMQSVALASAAYRTIPRRRKKNRSRKMLKGYAKIMTGIPLTQATAQMIGGMD